MIVTYHLWACRGKVERRLRVYKERVYASPRQRLAGFQEGEARTRTHAHTHALAALTALTDCYHGKCQWSKVVGGMDKQRKLLIHFVSLKNTFVYTNSTP